MEFCNSPIVGLSHWQLLFFIIFSLSESAMVSLTKLGMNKCGICGSSKARTLCPALDGALCSFCCGIKRGSKINCPATCAHFPFSIAGYDLWLKIDNGLVPKMMNYLGSEYSRYEFEEAIENMRFGDEAEEIAGTAEGAAAYYLFFVRQDQTGLTLARKLQSQGWQGLNNDERIMMEHRFNCRATVIEIQKVLDHQCMECVDLLEPEKGSFILIDRSVASVAVRFERFLSWLAHYPYFSRGVNNALEVPDFIFAEFMDALRQLFNKERRKHKGLTVKDCLSEKFGISGDLIWDLSRSKRAASLNKMDLHQCKAVYEIKGDYARIKEVLDNYPDFDKEDDMGIKENISAARHYVWLRKGQSKAIEKDMLSSFQHDDISEGVGVLGNISLFPDKVVVEAFTKQKYAFAKTMVDKFFGDNLIFHSEIVVDLAKQMAGKINVDRQEDVDEQVFKKDARSDKDLSAELKSELFEKTHQRHYTIFIDDKIPALGNITPRQAAIDPKARLRLIELMKQHIKGIEKQNKKNGLNLSIDWVLDELSLSELK